MGEIMNYSLLNEFEKYIYRNFDKCISPVLPPFLCSKHNYGYESMIND